MAKYFRKRSRFTRRRYFKASRIRKPRPGTRRFFKKQRKWTKPEIKYIDRNIDLTVGGNGSIVQSLSPLTISVGGGVAGRIGRSVKYRKVIAKMRFTTSDDQALADVRADGAFRVVIWSPRRPFTECQDYFNFQADLFTRIMDFNMITVHRDQYIRVGYQNYTYTAGTTNLNSPAVYPTDVAKTWIVPFPRTVDFGAILASENTVDPNKDILYVSFINESQFRVTCDISTRTTFIDP